MDGEFRNARVNSAEPSLLSVCSTNVRSKRADPLYRSHQAGEDRSHIVHDFKRQTFLCRIQTQGPTDCTIKA